MDPEKPYTEEDAAKLLAELKAFLAERKIYHFQINYVTVTADFCHHVHVQGKPKLVLGLLPVLNNVATCLCINLVEQAKMVNEEAGATNN